MLLRDPLLWMLSTWGGWGVSELTVKSFPRSEHVGGGVKGVGQTLRALACMEPL